MASGLDVVIAHQRGAVWNTPVTANVANAGLLLTQWPIGNGLGDLLYDDSLSGTGFRANAIRGLAKLTGNAPGMLRYTGLEHALAMSMGIAGVPTVTDTTAQTHLFQLATNLDGLYDTMAVNKIVSIWEYASVKFTGFQIVITADGLATIQFYLVASSCKFISGQTNTTLAAVTYRSKLLNIFGTHCKFRANAASAGALSDSDKFYPSQLTLNYQRNMDGDYVLDGTGIQTEPSYTAAPTVTCDLQFPVYGTSAQQFSNTLLANAVSETPLKMDITMTSPVLAGAATVPYSMLIQSPNVVIGQGTADVGGPGKIPGTLQLAMIEATVAPTGMPGLVKPFQLTNVSKATTNMLLNP